MPMCDGTAHSRRFAQSMEQQGEWGRQGWPLQDGDRDVGDGHGGEAPDRQTDLVQAARGESPAASDRRTSFFQLK
jgi:hypothetical protein